MDAYQENRPSLRLRVRQEGKRERHVTVSAGDESVETQELKDFYDESLIRHFIEVTEASLFRLADSVSRMGHKGIRGAHERVLGHLSLNGSRLVDIARASGVSKNMISQLAKELVEMGYIEKAADPSDGRAQIIKYSEKGLRLIADARKCNEALEAEMASRLGEKKLAQLKKLMVELAHRMRSTRGG